eukprot:908042-Prymnesium_polylepis.1
MQGTQGVHPGHGIGAIKEPQARSPAPRARRPQLRRRPAVPLGQEDPIEAGRRPPAASPPAPPARAPRCAGWSRGTSTPLAWPGAARPPAAPPP